jgi:hypothetical protein
MGKKRNTNSLDGTLFVDQRTKWVLVLRYWTLKISVFFVSGFSKLLSEEGVWQELLSNKYVCGKTLSQVQAKPTDSPFWKGIMGVQNDFFQRVTRINSTNVLDEGLRIGEIGRQMNSKVRLVEIGVYRK